MANLDSNVLAHIAQGHVDESRLSVKIGKMLIDRLDEATSTVCGRVSTVLAPTLEDSLDPSCQQRGTVAS